MEDVAYFEKGKVRKRVLYAIKDKPKTATMLSKELGIHRSSASRILLEVKEDGYSKCLNPSDDKQRYYTITGKGLKLIEKAEKYE